LTGPSFHKDLEVAVDPIAISRKEKRLAKAMAEKRHEMDQINTKVQPHRAQIKLLDKEIDALVADIENGTEKRPVACHEIRDFNRNVIRTVREDNGKLIDERAMTAEDRELEFGDQGRIESEGDDGDADDGAGDVQQDDHDEGEPGVDADDGDENGTE